MGKSIILRKRIRSNIRRTTKNWAELDPVSTGNFCYLSLPEWFNMKSKRRKK